MVAIATPHVLHLNLGTEPWPEFARATRAWALADAVDLSEAIVLLPFTALLPLARRAFAQAGGWMPRIETTRTLARTLGPAQPVEPGAPTGDRVVDLLVAAELLRAQNFGVTWAQRDRRGFDQAVADVVATAHAFMAAAAQTAPERRAQWLSDARAVLALAAGPGATERALARLALEWAALAPTPDSDRLFGLRPSAWVMLRAGGADPLVDSLLATLPVGMPSLVIDTDPSPDDPFSDAAIQAPALAVCDGFEHEAQCAAAQVVEHLRLGESPVALIAQDRVLVRRVRALLERRQVLLLDETGWKLSTTRAAARVMGLLRAAAQVQADAVLDWLKTGTAWPQVPNADAALRSFEATLRRRQWRHVPPPGTAGFEPGAAGLWAAASAVLILAQPAGRTGLQSRLDALAAALEACGAAAGLRADDAGRQVLTALRLDAVAAGPAWTAQARATVMDADEFSLWVDRLLEQESFVPTQPDSAGAQVVITPLARAMLRPFAAVVFPGADDRQLGAAPTPPPLLSDAEAIALGLPDAARQRGAETAALVQLLRMPSLTLLRRRMDGRDPLGASQSIERLAAAGVAPRAWQDVRGLQRLAATPIVRSAPTAPSLLPASLSASACEALRDCPYRFFALNMLRLREDDELDGEIEKRDYGDWLHAVLWKFHQGRAAPRPAADEVAQLFELAAATQHEQGLTDADFVPFAASFERLAPLYIDWLHQRDRQGARWLTGEERLAIRPPALGGIELAGRVDRIDTVPRAGGAAAQLIDYKTGQVEGLKQKVKDLDEDTQLAFYAALAAARAGGSVEAMYLALDGSQGIAEVPHPGVQRSAERLLAGLADDIERLRAGAGLAPLGEGRACEWCAARGICRRDHWSGQAPA